MADIELVIKIPKELYETYKGRPPMLGDAGMDMIAQSIANGTPLPEHHGRLIDADEFEVVGLQDKSIDFIEGARWMLEKIDNAPTIVEAEGSENE